MKFVVGLTGGIGAGKTAVADRLASLGASLVDTDAISRALTGPHGGAMPRLREAFGERFVTAEGALDREAMRALVFSDGEARARLEAILHPAIREASDRELERASGPYAVLVVPLLFETRGYGRVARVLVVDCPEALQVERLRNRSGLDEREARAVMAAQWPRWRRLQMADDVIWNGADRASLERQCDARHRDYCERASASATIAAKRPVA
ncbi:MAG: dephospho-CoA kinase [Bacillota bacterium]